MDLDAKEKELKERELKDKEKELELKEIELAQKEAELNKKTGKSEESTKDETKNSSKNDSSNTGAILCCLGIIIIAVIVSHAVSDSNTSNHNTTDINLTNNSAETVEVINATTNDKFTYYGYNSEYNGYYTFVLTVNGTDYGIEYYDELVFAEHLPTFKNVSDYDTNTNYNHDDELVVRNIFGGRVGTITSGSKTHNHGVIFTFPVDKNFSFTYENVTRYSKSSLEIDKVYW